jgi:outer membrane protein W
MSAYFLGIYLMENLIKKWGAMFLLAGTLLLTLSSHTYASNRAGALSLTLGGGVVDFSSKRHIDNTGYPFIAMGYQFTDRLGIEGLFAGFITRSHRPVDDNRQVRGAMGLVDGTYHFSPLRMFEPFVLAGVGMTGMNPNGTDADVQGNVNAGVGVQIFLDKSFALRFEARDLYTTVEGKNDVLFNAGVTLLLDLC